MEIIKELLTKEDKEIKMFQEDINKKEIIIKKKN